jgi:hypothetical protein
MSGKPSYVKISVDPFYAGNSSMYRDRVKWKGCITTVYTREERTFCNMFSSFEDAHNSMIVEKNKLEKS